jgi:hypothetical protein
MMGQQAASQRFDLIALTEGRLQRLDPANRLEITKLLGLLLSECVGLTAKAKEADDESLMKTSVAPETGQRGLASTVC